jgi:hypothetical protein
MLGILMEHNETWNQGIYLRQGKDFGRNDGVNERQNGRGCQNAMSPGREGILQEGGEESKSQLSNLDL